MGNFFLPPVHNPFEVKCCGCQHDIDVIAYYPLVKVAAEAMIRLQVSYDGLNSGTFLVPFA